jgi:hypothetical protein
MNRDVELVFVSTASVAVFHIPNLCLDNINILMGLPPMPNPWLGVTAFSSRSISKDDGQISCGRLSIFIGSPPVISGYGVGIQIRTKSGFHNSELMILQTSAFTMFSFLSPLPLPTVSGQYRETNFLLHQ